MTNGALNFPKVGTPTTPSAGRVFVYTKSDAHLYVKDDDGTERPVDGSSDAVALTMRLGSSASVAATTITLRTALDPAVEDSQGYLIIDPFTAECEIRSVVTNGGTSIGVDALTYAHAAGDIVLWTADTEFSVLLFGAKVNDDTDDTLAWQRALVAVAALGGGTITCPTGTSIVHPTTSSWLVVGNNTRIRGQGQGSTIKVKNSNGQYYAIIAGASPSTHVQGFTLERMTIDQNGDNNPIALTGDPDFPSDVNVLNQYRYVLGLYTATDVRVLDSTFLNIQTINCIVVNSSTYAGSVWIQRNRFFVGGSAVFHDSSTLYLQTSDVDGAAYVSDNWFYGRAIGSRGAGTAVEIHGSNLYVDSNYIENFGLGVYMVGIRPNNINNDQRFTNNKIVNCLRGIDILPLYSGGVYTEPWVLRDVYITGNNITVERDGWVTDFPTRTPDGIVVSNTDGAIKNLYIEDNTVFFNAYTDTGSSDSLNGGIKIRADALYSGKFYENLSIVRNTIENAPAQGIHVGTCLVRHLRVEDNLVLNAGRSPGSFSSSFRCGIYITALLTDAMVNNNHIINMLATNTTLIGINLLSTSVTAGQCKNNTVYAAAGPFTITHFGYTADADGKAWLVEHRASTGGPPSTVYFKYGSTWMNTQAGQMNTQHTSPSGAGWQRSPVIQSGNTAGRPSAPIAGLVYFDTTIGLPIWYNGSAWKDATGTTV